MTETATCTTQVIAGGRVTLSAPVRKTLDLDDGDYVEVQVRRLGGEAGE